MKKLTIILTVLIALVIKTNAQIPNNGFEDWSTISGIEIPSDAWVTANLHENPEGVTYKPVTKSTDHYPQNVGVYSIRMENNISFVNTNPASPMLYMSIAYGMTATAPLTSHYLGYNGPSFPITGHPESFCGYYKFLPSNNDTLTIGVVLFQNGSPVVNAYLYSTAIASEWTAFSLPIPNYTSADSAQIFLMALTTLPQGNSILYVDNLSFDELITTSVNREHGTIPGKFELGQNYPNPFNPATSISFSLPSKSFVSLKIFDPIGKEVATIVSEELSEGSYTKQWNATNLTSGVYFYRIQAGSFTETKKLILLR